MATKNKSHAWLKKRIKITWTGKIMVKKEGNNHLLTNKGKNNKKSPYGNQITWFQAKRIKDLVY